MAERGIGAHHLAFDTLVTGGWCRLAVGDIDHAAALAARASADADTLASAWNQLQAGYLGARLALVTGDPTRCLQIVDELRQEIPFDVCHPYSERLLGIEIEALAAAGRVVEAVRAIDALEPDPRTRLLRARYEGGSEGTIAELLEGHEAWPALERIQAELLLRTHGNASAPSEDLVALVAECGRTGWVLPFLGFGPRVERLLRSTPLATIHPQLAATLDDVAPADRVDGPACARVQLTSRERSLVDLLPTHLTYAEMGERLYLSVNTVKAYLKSVYRKLGVSTRAEAVEASRQAGLL
jgi:LuxR family maltose regulon positive regulatory protein